MKITQFPYSETILSVNSLWMASVMFLNQDIFDSMPRLFEKMSSIASQEVWGVIFLIAAFIKIIGMLIKNCFLRQTGLWTSAVLYGFLAAFFGMGSIGINLEAGFCGTLCFMAFRGLRGVGVYGRSRK